MLGDSLQDRSDNVPEIKAPIKDLTDIEKEQQLLKFSFYFGFSGSICHACLVRRNSNYPVQL